jgi:hypothetical protein
MSKIINTDNQELIKYSRGLSDHLLTEFGEFFPFAAQINNRGELTGIGYESEIEFPTSQEVIDELTIWLEKELEQNSIRSFCITHDSKLKNNNYPNGIDCIISVIKHKKNNTIMEFSFPYLIKKKKEIEYYEAWSIEK